MEHESHHHHHPHGTGMRWLDITLGVAAPIVSLVSLWLGLHSAHSMEKMVAANSYPYVELMRTMSVTRGSETERVQHLMGYQMDNNGVGPARVEWVEMRFKDKPVQDITGLLEACCEGPKYDYNGLSRRGDIDGALIRPGASVKLFTWSDQGAPNTDLEKLYRQMDDIDWSVCYCSVFDECYVRSTRNRKPEAVKECKAPAVRFRPAQRGDK